jgi:mannose-6-phosphate isomerase-like protein (cupin superfamily)
VALDGEDFMVERIMAGESMIALIIRANHHEEGIEFFTPPGYSQQLAYMNRPAGYRIPPHIHNPVPRDVIHTQEVLVIRSGRLKVDFYDHEREFLEERELGPGDVILLASGGHGFTMLEPTEMIEVKQGPYAGEDDKTLLTEHER